MSTESSPPDFTKPVRTEDARAQPVPLEPAAGSTGHAGHYKPQPGPHPEVHRPGTGVTALMLARYLVGRALAARVSATLWIVGVVVLLAAAGLWFVAPHWVAVIVGLLGLVVLAFRALVMLVLRKVMAVGRLGQAEARITELVHDTGGDLRRELRRIGLPGSVIAMPLLLIRIVGKRRGETFEKMRRFDVANVVPRTRRAELEFIIRDDVLGRPQRRP